MSVKRELIKGTLILTAAGFAARLLGFFNRVYLANLISNAELGRYQLIFPIFMFCMAVSCAGIQVAVSKMVAAYHGAGKKIGWDYVADCSITEQRLCYCFF